MNSSSTIIVILVSAYLLVRTSQKAVKLKRSRLWLEPAFFAIVLLLSLGVEFGILKSPFF